MTNLNYYVHVMRKKYVKLTGCEVPTPEAQAAADAFMRWYADNYNKLRTKWLYAACWDPDVAGDTALRVYEAIALRGAKVQDYKFYYLRAYHQHLLKHRTKESKRTQMFLPLDEGSNESARIYQAEEHDGVMHEFRMRMLRYVRSKYTPYHVTLFEIYMGLLPDTSYNSVAKLLGVPASQVGAPLVAMRKDLREKFANEAPSVISLDEFII